MKCSLAVAVDYVVQEPLPETLQERRPPEFGEDQNGQKLALGGTGILVTKSHLDLSLMAKFQSPWSGHLETSWGCGRGGERGEWGHPESSRKQLKGGATIQLYYTSKTNPYALASFFK